MTFSIYIPGQAASAVTNLIGGGGGSGGSVDKIGQAAGTTSTSEVAPQGGLAYYTLLFQVRRDELFAFYTCLATDLIIEM